MANYYSYLQSNSNDAYYRGNGTGTGKFKLGNLSSGNPDGAVRFPSVGIGQGVTVNAASLRLWSQFQGTNTSGTIGYIAHGIKETNTSGFNVSDPFSRPATSGSITGGGGEPINNFFPINVTSLVNEILGQPGWSSGNAMGFTINNNNSSTNCEFEDWSLKAQLLIQVTAPGNFTPTPGTIPSPTFPASSNWGFKISEPGVDVKVATESQLYFTSRKKELRIGTELSTNGGSSVYTHGLGYPPSVLGYYTNSGTCRIMNVPSNVFSVEEYIASDATNVYYFLNGTAEAGYLYIFIDPLS